MPLPTFVAPNRATMTPSEYVAAADQFAEDLVTAADELNAINLTDSYINAATAQAAAAAAVAAADSALWVSGTTYAAGDVVYSPSNYQSYRRKTGGAGTTDPSADTTNWAPVVDASIGKHTIWIPAAAMIARTTNGPASGSAETTTNKVMLRSFDFDAATQEYVQFAIQMPKGWDEGTVTFAPVWSHSGGANFGVTWNLAGVAFANDDAADTAFGTAQTSSDTGGTTNDIYIGPVSSAITIAGSPAAQEYVVFQLSRVVADAGDTLTVDARLHGIQLFYTTDQTNDA